MSLRRFKLKQPAAKLEIADFLIEKVGQPVIQVQGGDFYSPRPKPYQPGEQPGADWKERQIICLMDGSAADDQTSIFYINEAPDLVKYCQAAEQLVAIEKSKAASNKKQSDPSW